MGDDEISNEFLRRHYANLLALMRSRVRDPALAADLLNDALVIAMSHLREGRIRERDKLPGYVFRVAMNLHRNHRREFDNRSDLRVQPEDFSKIPDSSSAELIDADLLERVRSLIRELPTPRDREIVTRFYLQEEEKESICQALHLSALHFDRVIFRARKRMRSLLESKGLGRTDFFSMLIACLA